VGVFGFSASAGANTVNITCETAASDSSPASTPCVFIGGVSCQSSDPQVTLDATIGSGGAGCTFGISVDWGDALSTGVSAEPHERCSSKKARFAWPTSIR
jgi:hypothetical protein